MIRQAALGSLVYVSRVVLAAVVIVTLPVAAAASSAAPRGGWISPRVVNKTGSDDDPSVAVAPGGVAVAMWTGPDLRRGAQVSTRTAGGRWAPAITLGGEHGNPPNDVHVCVFDSHLAVTASGGALVVCARYDSAKWQQPASVLAYERTGPSGSWRGPITLSQPVYAQSQLALAGDDAGAAVVAWNSIERNGDPAVARAALRRVDGTWETPQNLGYADSARIETSPSVAMDARGDALVVWTKGPPVPPDFTVTSQSVVYAEFRPAGGAWGPAAVLSQSAIDGGQTRVAVNREGDALVVWSERDQTGRDLLLSSFRRAGASGWTQPLPVPVTDPLAARDDYESGVSFALDDAGDATLVTSRPSGEVEALTHAADASAWAGPVVLGRGENRSESECVRPQVAMDGRGDAVVVWRGAELYAARRAAGSAAWEQPVIVAPDPTCEGRALTADSTGDAVAIWKTPIGLVDRLESAVFDTTPPVLAKLRIPSVARIGSRVRFAVTASDLWSSVAGPPLWHFGDGTTRKGATVAHTFRRPGRYRVSVTATDEAGNTATSFGLVRMTARP